MTVVKLNIRMISYVFFLLSVCLFLASCKKESSPRSSSVLNPPNSLPTAEVTVAGKTFTAELATNNRSRALGLMYRPHLPADAGMLFVFKKPQTLSFYMKNCLIDLDILYLDKDGAIIDIYTMKKPVPGRPLRNYVSSAPALYALELPAGTAQKLNLQPGQKVELPPSVTGKPQ